MKLGSRWLSPEGELIFYEGLSHAYSEPFIIRKFYDEVVNKKLPPYYFLEKRGWIRLSDSGFDKLMFILNKGMTLNDVQNDFVKEWCDKHDRDYNNVIFKIQ